MRRKFAPGLEFAVAIAGVSGEFIEENDGSRPQKGQRGVQDGQGWPVEIQVHVHEADRGVLRGEEARHGVLHEAFDQPHVCRQVARRGNVKRPDACIRSRPFFGKSFERIEAINDLIGSCAAKLGCKEAHGVEPAGSELQAKALVLRKLAQRMFADRPLRAKHHGLAQVRLHKAPPFVGKLLVDKAKLDVIAMDAPFCGHRLLQLCEGLLHLPQLVLNIHQSSVQPERPAETGNAAQKCTHKSQPL